MEIHKKSANDDFGTPFQYIEVKDDSGNVLFSNYPSANFVDNSKQDATCLLIMQCIYLGFLSCKNDENIKVFQTSTIESKEIIRFTKEDIEIREDIDNNKFEHIFK
ncbi:MAG: hypothetical protein PHF86_11715 [Candidatus Nanoarchaeia archaeon]|nr:hypothetical protein [Candidatus Nanoarchaeia archaeon]